MDSAPTDTKIDRVRQQLAGADDPLALLEALFVASPVAFQIYRADGRCLLVNQAFRDLFGSEPPPEYNVLRDEIAERDGMLGLIHRAFAGETVAVPAFWYDARELRQVQVLEGQRVAIESTFTPLRDRDGRVGHVAIAFKDVTNERLARERAQAETERAQRLLAEERAASQSFRAVFDHALDAMTIADDAGYVLDANAAACALFGMAREELVGTHSERLTVSDSHVAFEHLRQDFFAKGADRGELTLRTRDGSVRHVEYSATAGILPGRHLSVMRDVGDRRRGEDALRFLADAGATLAASLDYETTLANIVRLAVPRVADWCSVDLVQPDGSVRQLAVAHADPARTALARELNRRFPPSPDAPTGVPHVVRTREIEFVPEITEAMIVASTPDPELCRLALALGMRSWICVPIVVHGRALGAITLVSADSGRRYGPADVDLARELAQRAGVAIENAQLYREAREANRIKDEFLATLSHELRTPLNAILGWTRMLRAGTLPEARRERALETVERNAAAQARLIEELLDLSRVVSGKLRVELAQLDPTELVERATETIRPAAEAKGVRILQVLDGSAPPIAADADRLRQIVWNLLSNAVKFTPRGGRVTTRVERRGSHVEIVVEDTGEGIAPELLPHVFERFRQGDSSATRTHGGLGLGLAIARHLVELHGGQIAAQSDGVDKGSRFVVRLPVATVRAAPPDVRAEKPRLEGASFAGLRVLVVDDDDDGRELVASVLEDAGATVEAVGSARDALAAFERARPDVLVSDIGMPGEDGYALVRRLRAMGAAAMSAVALTAYARAEDRAAALAAGFDAHIAKPAEVAELVATIASLTRRAPVASG